MNDLGNLLQLIYDLLSGWYNAFTDHAVAVLAKLDLIEDDTSSIKNSASDIKSNTDDIKDNTGAIITPVQSIKTNTDSIKTDTTNIKNNVSTMTNQLGTINSNVGSAKAFTEDVANNTLEIKNKIVTIASDTTQMRSNSNNITSDVSDIKTALNYYLANTPVTEEVEGYVCNIDTDLSDYLEKCKVSIPADLTGFSGITLSKIGKNICPALISSNNNGLTTTISADGTIHVVGTATGTGGYITTSVNFPFTILAGLQITLSISNTLTGSLRMIFNSGTADISINNKYTTMTANTNLTSGRLYLFTTANQSYDLSFKFQIEVGAKATAYEPYKSMTYPVSFGSTITDGAEIDLLEGIIKINSSPVSYQSITPIAVRTYKGVNNIYSDVGTTALTYRETLKHYMDKQEA